MAEDAVPSHSIQVIPTPTDDWMAALVLHTVDADGDETSVELHPHEAAVLGQLLVKFGIILEDLNTRLAEKSAEARQEIMEITAQFNMPSSTDSPFDPPMG